MGIFTVKNEPVSKGDSWILIIPIIPIWIWGFWRIQCLRRAISVIVGAWLLALLFQMTLPFPYGLGLVLVGVGWIGVFFHRRWTREWNAKF